MPKGIYVCDFCGENFKRYPSEIRGKDICCSMDCKYALASECKVGSKSPFWAGGYEVRRPVKRMQKIWNKYRLDFDRYEAILNEQKGCCKICGDSLMYPGSKTYFHIDHDHVTGRVRGFLCPHCNRLLGAARDNQRILKSAVRYLNE